MYILIFKTKLICTQHMVKQSLDICVSTSNILRCNDFFYFIFNMLKGISKCNLSYFLKYFLFRNVLK